MRIGVVGAGYVGLVTGTCLADAGNHVKVVDVDAAKVDRLGRGEIPIYEPGLDEMVRYNCQANRLHFTTDFTDTVSSSEAIFIAVGTPPSADGSADLSAVFECARQIATEADRSKLVIIKSTVPVGTAARVRELVEKHGHHEIMVANNPEFLKEGHAVEDFRKPDRVVIGCHDRRAADILKVIYSPFVRNENPIIVMSCESAEMTKYAANALLATKISFINEVANICQAAGADINEVRRGIGFDQRIGFKFLFPGVGYGGSCFPKDVQALARRADELGVEPQILRAVHQVNQDQRQRFADQIVDRLSGTERPASVALWGLAFKPHTDDVREAPALAVIDALAQAGLSIRAHDPKAMENTRQHTNADISFHQDPYEVLDGASALVILTEWNEFRTPDFDIIKSRLLQPIVFDGRNLFEPPMMAHLGFEYHSIGRVKVGEVS